MKGMLWHKRYHRDAITGYMGLSLEERGAYSTILDYLYDRDEPLVANVRLLAGFLDCSVRKAKMVIEGLVRKGKLTRLEDGRITNARFEKEREKSARSHDHIVMIGSSGGNKTAEKLKKASKNKGRENSALKRGLSHTDTEDRVQKESVSTTELNSKRPSLFLPAQAPADAGKDSRKARSKVPDDFPSQEAKDAAVKFWRDRGRTDLVAEIEDEAAKFRDHFIGHGKPMANWPATWRNWVRNALKMSRPPRGWSPPPAATTPVSEIEQWVTRLELFHHGEEVASIDKGYWRDEWGAAPGRPGCQVPGAALKEYAARHRPKVATG